MTITVRIFPNTSTVGKLAEAELHFSGDALDGMKLVGFAVWEGRGGRARNVTFPARQYALNGERRTFALLRPIADTTAQDAIRSLVLDAYTAFEQAGATVVEGSVVGDGDEPSVGYKPEAAVLYDGTPGSGSRVRR